MGWHAVRINESIKEIYLSGRCYFNNTILVPKAKVLRAIVLRIMVLRAMVPRAIVLRAMVPKAIVLRAIVLRAMTMKNWKLTIRCSFILYPRNSFYWRSSLKQLAYSMPRQEQNCLAIETKLNIFKPTGIQAFLCSNIYIESLQQQKYFFCFSHSCK